MELFHSNDGPKLDAGVLGRMARLDKDLRVTYSPWAIDCATSKPLELGPDLGAMRAGGADMSLIHRRGGTHYLSQPMYTLWVWDGREGRYHMVRQYPVAQGFGHRELQALEGDCARFMTPAEMLTAHYAAYDAKNEKEDASYREERRDVIDANKGVINDVLGGAPGKTGRAYSGTRDGKIFSAPGVKHRGGAGTITKSDKEAGWEKPDRS